MDYGQLADWHELRRELFLDTDSRMSAKNWLFAEHCRRASEEVLGVLRPYYRAELLSLSEHTTETLSGTTTNTGTNTINDSGRSWAVNAFASSSLGFPVEAVIYDSDEFYIADVVSNTANAITISGIDGVSISVPNSAVYYLRMKLPELKSIVLSIALFNLLTDMRSAKGPNIPIDGAADRRNVAYAKLEQYVDVREIRNLITFKKTDSVTLNYYEWKPLTYAGIDGDSVVVTYDSTNYIPLQGYMMNCRDGYIRYDTPREDQTTYLTGSETLSVTYRYSLRRSTSGMV